MAKLFYLTWGLYKLSLDSIQMRYAET